VGGVGHLLVYATAWRAVERYIIGGGPQAKLLWWIARSAASAVQMRPLIYRAAECRRRTAMSDVGPGRYPLTALARAAAASTLL